MTNKEIIAAVEELLHVKVVEDFYPLCEYFVGMRFDDGNIVFIDKMTGANEDGQRRQFTADEQMDEIRERCEVIREYVQGCVN